MIGGLIPSNSSCGLSFDLCRLNKGLKFVCMFSIVSKQTLGLGYWKKRDIFIWITYLLYIIYIYIENLPPSLHSHLKADPFLSLYIQALR